VYLLFNNYDSGKRDRPVKSIVLVVQV